MTGKVLYLIGSLRNKRVPELAKRIREECPDVEVFDDWFAAGPEADDFWKEYEQSRGRTYQEALAGYAAKNVFSFDRRHLDRATHTLLVLPAGKSGHMEIMYACYGAGSNTAILLDPEDVRWDVMYQFIPTILESDDEIKGWLGDGEAGRDVGRTYVSSRTVGKRECQCRIGKSKPAGRRQVEERISDGDGTIGLLPECIGGSRAY